MKPLEGITVLDFTQAYNGPYCTMNLADNGARVIKVERTTGGDQSRFWGPHPKPEIREQLKNNGTSGYFAAFNRNKESIAVDLGTDKGKEIIKKLYGKVDVVLENFKYGTIDKLGLGYDVAKAINPEIIFVSASGYGQEGPLRRKTAYDNVIECMSGYMEMTGYPDRLPLRSGASVGDSYTGCTAFLGAVLACYKKAMTGKGSRVDVGMMDTMFAANEDGVLTYSLLGEKAIRTANARPKQVVPYDTFECSDGHIAVGLSDEEQYTGFCHAIGTPELIYDDRFATNDLRVKNYEKFDRIIKAEIIKRTKKEMISAFISNGVPASEILIPLEALNNEHFLERNMIITLEDANVGKYRTFGLPIKFSNTPGGIDKASPLLGQDTRTVLLSLGYSEKEIETLLLDEVIGTPDSLVKHFSED